jgi:hypothetical protein
MNDIILDYPLNELEVYTMFEGVMSTHIKNIKSKNLITCEDIFKYRKLYLQKEIDFAE